MSKPQRAQPPASPSCRLYLRAGSHRGAYAPVGVHRGLNFRSFLCALGVLCGEKYVTIFTNASTKAFGSYLGSTSSDQLSL